MADAALGNLDFDAMLRYVQEGHAKPKAGKSRPPPPRKFHLPNLGTSTGAMAHAGREHGEGEQGASTSIVVREENLTTRLPKRRSKKNQASYESDCDTQIALSLARLRRDVLELQEVSEEEMPEEEPKADDDAALVRLRSFRELLGIPDPEPLQLAPPPKAKMNHKRRHNASVRYPRKGSADSAERSESQLLERLRKLRESLTISERSKSSHLQRDTRKKRIQPRAKYYRDRIPSSSYDVGAELHPTALEHPQPQPVTPLQLEGVHQEVAKELHQHWSMDLNNAMHMEFGIEGGQADQFGGSNCGTPLQQYSH